MLENAYSQQFLYKMSPEGQKYMEFLYSLTFFTEPSSSFSDSEADGLNQIEVILDSLFMKHDNS